MAEIFTIISIKSKRHGADIFLIARTDPDGTFYNQRDIENPGYHHYIDLAAYTLRR